MSENLRFSPNIDPNREMAEEVTPENELKISDSLNPHPENETEYTSPVEMLISLEGEPGKLRGFLMNHSYLQRDSGQTWSFLNFIETARGEAIQLKNLENGGVVNLNLADFVSKLKSEGSAWSIPE